MYVRIAMSLRVPYTYTSIHGSEQGTAYYIYLIGIVGVRMYVIMSYVHINISMIYMSLSTTTCMDVCTYIVTRYIRMYARTCTCVATPSVHQG